MADTRKWYQKKATWAAIIIGIGTTLKTIPETEMIGDVVLGLAGAFGLYAISERISRANGDK